MKGFIKTLEAIIASMIILVTMLYFFTFQVSLGEWSNALVQINAEDSLASIYKSGLLTTFVRQNDKESLNNKLMSMLPRTIGFSTEIRGVPNPNIYIGVMNSSDLALIDSMLDDIIYYKKRNISIHIKEMAWDNIEKETNIIFVSDYNNIDGAELDDFLKRGSVILRQDLIQSDLQNQILSDVFDLVWVSGNPSGNAVFYKYNKANLTSFRISNYFANISGKPIDNQFSGFNTVSRIGTDDKTIVRDDTAAVSYAKVNFNITKYGKGRAVWLAEDSASGSNKEEINNLTTALIMWASGERYNMDYPYEKIRPDIYSKASYVVSEEEVYEIVLTFWRIFY